MITGWVVVTAFSFLVSKHLELLVLGLHRVALRLGHPCRWLTMTNSHFVLSPETLCPIQVWTLAGPLNNLHSEFSLSHSCTIIIYLQGPGHSGAGCH